MVGVLSLGSLHVGCDALEGPCFPLKWTHFLGSSFIFDVGLLALCLLTIVNKHKKEKNKSIF